MLLLLLLLFYTDKGIFCESLAVELPEMVFHIIIFQALKAEKNRLEVDLLESKHEISK